MQHGLTREPNDRDLGAIDALRLEHAFDGLRVRLGDQLFGFAKDPRARALRSASVCRSRMRSGVE